MASESSAALSGSHRDGWGGARQSALSTLAAGGREKRFAIAIVLVSVALFAAVAPFATRPLAPAAAFLPAYQSALVVCDLITAVLLFGQFSIVRSRSLLVLASAYLFSACLAVVHALSFPGLLAPSGLLGGGAQSTAWLYFLWHAGFPILVIAYALQEAPAIEARRPQDSAYREILASVAAVILLAVALTLAATAGHDALPAIMQGDRDAPAKAPVATATWLVSLIALPVIWRRRPLSVIDVWLMVTVWVWLFDTALAAVLNAGRYDVGWYAGRIYGLIASSLVLVVLLFENSALYGRVVEAREAERRHALDSLGRQAERLRILHEIDRATIAGESPEAIAGRLVQPLRDLIGLPRVIVNLFDLEAGEVEWLAAAGRNRVRVGPGVRYSLRLMGDLEALRRGEAQIVDTRALPPGPETDALLASGVHVYMVVPMIAGGELIGALSFGGDRNEFAEEQAGIAREVATQLAIAITQARLLDRVRLQADELEKRVRERTTELQASNRELEAFSYSVSHDLRSPLRAVDGYAQMLQEDYAARLDDEGRRLLGVVRDEAARMGQLIDDLLRLSQIGRKPLARHAFDMRALAAEVVAELAPAYPHARVELAALPPAAGDRALLRQVWVNLIGNALKYSSRSPAPRVEIDGTIEAPGNVYRVRDNGAGFDMRYEGKLFKVFQRLHSQEEFQGTGVGLAIVERVVARHGGRVWAKSAPDAGASFHFELPREG